MLEGVHALWLFIWTHLQPFEPKKRKNQFSGGKSAKSLGKRSTVRQTCSKTLVRYLGRSMGHYPFGIFKIGPEIRSGRRFEKKKKKNPDLINHRPKPLKNGPLCTKHVQKIWFNTWEGPWDPILLEFLESNLKWGQDGGLKIKSNIYSLIRLQTAKISFLGG